VTLSEGPRRGGPFRGSREKQHRGKTVVKAGQTEQTMKGFKEKRKVDKSRREGGDTVITVEALALGLDGVRIQNARGKSRQQKEEET